MSSFAFDSCCQCWLLLFFFCSFFSPLYFTVDARLQELKRKMNSRAQAGDNRVCLINFTFLSPGPYKHSCLSLYFSAERNVFPLHTTRTNAVKTGRRILLLLIKQLYLFSVVMSEAPFAGLNSIPRRRDKINLYGRPWVNVCGRGREVPTHAICALCFLPRFSMNTAHSNVHKGVLIVCFKQCGKTNNLVGPDGFRGHRIADRRVAE